MHIQYIIALLLVDTKFRQLSDLGMLFLFCP